MIDGESEVVGILGVGGVGCGGDLGEVGEVEFGEVDVAVDV